MSEQKQFDPETVTLEELRAEVMKTENQELPIEQPRNADGTFAPKETPAVVETPAVEAPPVEKKVYETVIDLEDGSGVQVFRATTQEELIEKLVTAQKNASKKIRELNARLPRQENKPERNADEEFGLAQEFMTTPSKAFQKLFKDTVGMPIEEFKTKIDRVNAFEAAQAREQAGRDFVAQTPEYFPSVKNGTRISNFLKTYQLEPTPENMTKAFTELNESGLLEAKPTEAPTPTPTPTPAPRRSGSGLPVRGSAQPSRPTNSGPTEEELYNMPLEKLRELGRTQPQE